MSKNMIIALIVAQFNGLNASTNVERLGYTIAGIKDGKFYDHKTDTDYGVFDETAPDCEFITEKQVNSSRINSTTLAQATIKMQKYFAELSGEVVEDETPTTTDGDRGDAISDSEPVEDEIDFEAVEKACKKAIKKGDAKKATKLLAKLEGQDCYKKLSKKLGKL